MIPRIVAIPIVEANSPDDANPTEQHKGMLPGHDLECEINQVRRKSAAPPCTQPHDPLSADALMLWQPGGEGFRQIRKAACFTGAEQRPCNDQRKKVPGPSCRGREERP